MPEVLSFSAPGVLLHESMRALIISVVLAANVTAAVTPRQSPRRSFAHAAAGTPALTGAAAGAAIGHARNSPREWGRSPAGFGKRFGSALGQHVAKTSIEFGVAALRHEDLLYHRSRRRGFRPRLKHALLSTVVTRKTTTGHRTAASGRISGALGSGLLSRLWQPARLHTVSSGLGSAGISLGADAAANVAVEFWPRHSQSARQRPQHAVNRRVIAKAAAHVRK
jgi:hypothetical protein